jgi:hypothetical protein
LTLFLIYDIILLENIKERGLKYMHMVICSICGERFDRDKVQAVKTSARRYAHLRCKPDGEKVPLPNTVIDEDLQKLEEYIKKLLNEDYVNARVKKQIKDFKEEYGYSYSGMLKSLVYFYEVKGNSIEKANGGIGILPFVYQDAYNYYYSLYLAQLVNEEKDVNQYKTKVREIVIKSPSVAEKPVRLFDLGED